MSLIEPTKKRRKVSKNKKRNWAKTNITDVEEHLESERIQLRTGGLAEEKADEQLFFVDTKDVADSKENAPKKKRNELKTLKCHANLIITTGAKPIVVSRPTPESKKKKASSGPTKAEQEATEQRKETQHKKTVDKAKRLKRIASDKNLWEDDNAPKNDIDQFVTKQQVKVPISVKRKIPSVLPAVEVAHPGQSYNPSLDDHQDLMRKAVDVELKKEKWRLKLKRALDDAFPSEQDAPTEASYIEEMSAGLFEGPDEDGEEEDDIVTNPPVRRENKKTDRQRKKQLARKKKEEARLKAKEEKLRKQNLFRIKSIKREVKARENELEDIIKQRAEKTEADKSKTKKLSAYKYEDACLPLKLSHELDQSLRRLKPEGHLIEDRFKSLQKRNIIETRQRQKIKRKYKPKTFEKKSHKAVTV